jgi:hypothetical protein
LRDIIKDIKYQNVIQREHKLSIDRSGEGLKQFTEKLLYPLLHDSAIFP